jgi:hypothetical protein
MPTPRRSCQIAATVLSLLSGSCSEPKPSTTADSLSGEKCPRTPCTGEAALAVENPRTEPGATSGDRSSDARTKRGATTGDGARDAAVGFGSGRLETGFGSGSGGGAGGAAGHKGGRDGGAGPDKGKETIADVAPSNGGLSAEQIRTVVTANLIAIRRCYQVEAERNPSLRGGVTVQWTIDPSGHVERASVVDTTLDNPRVEGCITHLIKAWHFPKSETPTVVGSFPFKFGVGS